MEEVILPINFKISTHAAKRFLERVIQKDSYTSDDEEIALEIIRNILTNRVLKQQRVNDDCLKIKYRNAIFIYDTDTKCIITTYTDDEIKNKVDWIYKFPAPLRFKGNFNEKAKMALVSKGFEPLLKEKRLIIGQLEQTLYQYDPKYNVISVFITKIVSNHNV